MKKYLFAAFISFFTASMVLAEDFLSPRFMKALSNCSNFSENGNVKTEGIDFTSTKKILGTKNGKCIYQESINFSGNHATVTCKFSKQQINEIIEVMNAYDVVQKYSKEKIDTSSLSAVQDNPVVQVWNKYLQDKSVCLVE